MTCCTFVNEYLTSQPLAISTETWVRLAGLHCDFHWDMGKAGRKNDWVGCDVHVHLFHTNTMVT